MPRIVDHAVRRRELAEALWRIIVREGIEAVSVRNVAAESGWSAGALRHYFPDKASLTVFAMNLVTERVTERLQALDQGVDPEQLVLNAMEEVLPLDEVRMIESEVWLAFTLRARVDPALVEPAQDVYRRVREFLEQLLTVLGADHLTTEAGKLHALLDGLAVHLLLYPDFMKPAQARQQLVAYLATLPRTKSDG